MASETEGIAAILSMYTDDDEDEEDNPNPNTTSSSTPPNPEPTTNPNPNSNPSPPLLSDDSTDRKTLTAPSPLPVTSSPSPSSLGPTRATRGALWIVDYGQDEMAMSPEQEEGEILRSGGGFVGIRGEEVRVEEGKLVERTPSGTLHFLTPKTPLESSQPSDIPEQNQREADVPMDSTESQTEATYVEEAAAVSVMVQHDDALSRFLRPLVTLKCSAELQAKINKFLVYKKSGKSFNTDLRNRKDYRNPDFLQHAVRYQDIDQIGTCFSKDVFDPHGYDKSDYYDDIEADMKRELERKEQERKRSPKVEFVAGGVQRGTVAPMLKSAQPAAVSLSGIPQVPAVAEGSALKDTRQNKKSKWDKIDGDVKIPTVSTGRDNLSAIGMHAALLTAANAGAGCTAFAQQKRKEIEEKKTSDRRSRS